MKTSFSPVPVLAVLLAVGLSACARTASRPDAPPVQRPIDTVPADDGPWIVNKRALLVPLEAVRQRVQRLEGWLRDHRGHADAPRVLARADFYMHVYLTPDKWCKAGAHCATLAAERKASYGRFVAEQAGSRWEGKVASALRRISQGEASGPLASAQALVDGAYDEVAKQMMAWYGKRGDVPGQRAVGQAHTEWLQDYRRRFAAALAPLSAPDRARATAHEKSKLGPVLARMQVLIARSSDSN